MTAATELSLSFCAMTAGLVLLTAFALRLWPGLWTGTVEAVGRPRNATIDGARGLLTIWVLSHHLMMRSMADATGAWRAPPGALGDLILSGAFVAPFFMLTAMLFGGRLYATGGRLATMPFLVSRAFRIVPAYLVAVALLALGAFAIADYRIVEPWPKILRELARWSMFDFVQRYEINGVDMAPYYGVLWTLRFEILFYLALPVLAFAQRRTCAPLLPAAITLALGAVAWPFLFFGAGIAAAVCLQHPVVARRRTAWQVGAVAGIAAIVVAARAGIFAHALHAAALVPVFVCVAQEAPLLHPLRWRPFRLIGEISYSNYVLHGAVIVLVGEWLADFGAIAALPFAERAVILTAIGGIALAAAFACYHLVEQPALLLGGRLGGRLRPPRAAPIDTAAPHAPAIG